MTIIANVNLPCALATESQPLIYVDNAQATYRDELVTVNVSIADLSEDLELIGVQFSLRYNASLLETQYSWTTEATFMKSFGTTFFMSYNESDYVIVGILLLPNATGGWSGPFPQGSGTLATITFKALYPFYGAVGPVSSNLTLYDVILIDTDLQPISYTTGDGTVVFSVPTIAISPKLYVANRKGENVSINVNMEGINASWRLIGAQFKLQYNASLLQPVSVDEGTFLDSYGTTFFTSHNVSDYVIVGILLLPNATGGWSGPFPQGSGTLATITFEAIYQSVELSGFDSCDLTLYDTILLQDSLEEVPHSQVQGEYRITSETFRPVDIQVEAGTIHFRGEIVDFYMLVTDYGETVDPETIGATMYFNGTSYANLTGQLNRVTKGLYRATFEIPGTAAAGTYTLLVEAEYILAKGTAIGIFQVNPTLTGWNASLTEIRGNVGTIQTSIGVINTNLTAINAKLVSIENNVASIQTSIGVISTDLTAINATLVSIDGNVAIIQTSVGDIEGYVEDVSDGGLATINTEIGTVKLKVDDVVASAGTTSALLYVTLVLALIAAVGSMLSLMFLRRKQT